MSLFNTFHRPRLSTLAIAKGSTALILLLAAAPAQAQETDCFEALVSQPEDCRRANGDITDHRGINIDVGAGGNCRTDSLETAYAHLNTSEKSLNLILRLQYQHLQSAII